jgi:hypothetical protein
MKLIFNSSNAAIYQNIILSILNSVSSSSNQHQVNGFEYSTTADMIGVMDAINMFNDAVVISDFSIWIKVPNVNINDDVPLGLTFSYIDELNTIRRKWSDLSVLSQGIESSILYIDGVTSSISESDLDILFADSIAEPLSQSALSLTLADEEFYNPLFGTYEPYSYLSYQQIDGEWNKYFLTWYDAQTYMSGKWAEYGGDRYYPVKWRIEQPLTPEEEAIAYAIYPNFPYKEIEL